MSNPVDLSEFDLVPYSSHVSASCAKAHFPDSSTNGTLGYESWMPTESNMIRTGWILEYSRNWPGRSGLNGHIRPLSNNVKWRFKFDVTETRTYLLPKMSLYLVLLACSGGLAPFAQHRPAQKETEPIVCLCPRKTDRRRSEQILQSLLINL